MPGDLGSRAVSGCPTGCMTLPAIFYVQKAQLLSRIRRTGLFLQSWRKPIVMVPQWQIVYLTEWAVTAGPLVGVQELCAVPTEDARAPWAVAPVDRPIGGNDVGIVAWRLALRTPECPGGREVRTQERHACEMPVCAFVSRPQPQPSRKPAVPAVAS